MPKLTLGTLNCIETEDNWGSDDPYILANGTEVWRGKLNDGQRADVGAHIDFTTQVLLQLREADDADPDDDLGSWTVNVGEAGQGEKRAFFNGDDAHYELFYTVSP